MQDFPGAYGPAGNKRKVFPVFREFVGSSLQHKEFITRVDIPETTGFVP